MSLSTRKCQHKKYDFSNGNYFLSNIKGIPVELPCKVNKCSVCGLYIVNKFEEKRLSTLRKKVEFFIDAAKSHGVLSDSAQLKVY